MGNVGRILGEMPEPTRFRSRPVEIEAMQWLGRDDVDAEYAMSTFTDEATRNDRGRAVVRTLFMPLGSDVARDVLGPDEDLQRTLDGYTAVVYDDLHGTWVNVSTGDWIIRGTEGELYPCADTVLRKKYEPAEEFVDTWERAEVAERIPDFELREGEPVAPAETEPDASPGTFEVYEDIHGRFRFRLRDPNDFDAVIASGQGYASSGRPESRTAPDGSSGRRGDTEARS